MEILNFDSKLPGEQSASTTVSEDTEIVCENGVCFKRPKVKTNKDALTATEEIDASASGQQLSNEEKLERAKDLIEKKRKGKDEENERVRRTIILIY